MHHSDYLVAELMLAFESTFGRPQSRTYASSGRQFKDLFWSQVERQLPPIEVEFISWCEKHRSAALVAAKSGQEALAREEFRAIHARLSGANIGEEATWIIHAFLEAAEAYLIFRDGDSESAKDLVLHAARIDAELDQKYGYQILAGHQLQLAHNLLRVEIRRNNYSEAFRLGATLLEWLEYGAVELTSTCTVFHWREESLRSVPHTMRATFFNQVCGDLALFFVRPFRSNSPGLIAHLSAHATRATCMKSGYAVQAHGWLRLKWLAVQGATDEFLRTAASTIAIGRSTEPNLWLASVLETAWVCDGLGPAGHEASERLIEAVLTSPDTPAGVAEAFPSQVPR